MAEDQEPQEAPPAVGDAAEETADPSSATPPGEGSQSSPVVDGPGINYPQPDEAQTGPNIASDTEPAPAPEDEPDRAEIIAPLADPRRRGEGLDGEPSEAMTVTPDEREKLAALNPDDRPVAGEDYPVGDPVVIYEGAWVRLSDSENVRNHDERAVGKLARVSFAPVERRLGDKDNPRPYDYQDPETTFTVETRDELNLIIPGLRREDFTAVGTSGRHEVASYG